MDDIQRLAGDYPWVQTPLVVSAPMRLIALADMAVEVSKAGKSWKERAKFPSPPSPRNWFVDLLTNWHRRNWVHRRRNRCLRPRIPRPPRTGTTQKHHVTNTAWHLTNRYRIYQLGSEPRDGYPHYRPTPTCSSLVLRSFLHNLARAMDRKE